MKASIPTVLFLIFMVLKLTGHIAWSWWWVTCPLWGPFAVAATILAFATPLALYDKYKNGKTS